MQEREKSSTDELPPRGVRDLPLSFFCPTSRSSQESKGFFYQRATYKGSWSTGSQGSRWVCQEGGLSPQEGDVRKKRKEKKKTKEGGLLPQEGDVRKRRKERKNTKEGKKVPPVKARFRLPYTKNTFFFGSRVFGRGSGLSWLKYRLLQDLVYVNAMCEGSSRNGLLYAAKAVP